MLLVLFAFTVSGVAEMKVWEGGYVPAPEPVKSGVSLGVYIFPGWYRDKGRGDYPYKTHDEDSEWKLCVAKQPGPRPLLGFYDDSLPEVNDWHIKWAVEHGISWFSFDWYWNAGEKRLARSLEQGFLKAKYADMMKFCVHWCNHALDWKKDGKPAEMDFSRKALVEMTEYLAGNYFRLPNYLCVDGRPVVMVFVPEALIQGSSGPEGFRETLAEMNKVLRSKGIKDIYLVALGTGSAYTEAGFAAFTSYPYYGADVNSKYEFKRGFSLPYEEMTKHFETMWRTVTKSIKLPYIVPIGSNWDDRPRARENAAVITGKTPDKFEEMCRIGLKYIDKRTNLAIIEAWNEWGEGSYIEPDKEFKFEFLDKVRKVFAPGAPEAHTDLVPTAEKIKSFSVLNETETAKAAALEKRAYTPPPLAVRTTQVEKDKPLPKTDTIKEWEFESGSNEGWFPYQVENPEISDGTLKTKVVGEDPQLTTQGVDADVKDIECIALRMRTSENVMGTEVFYSTEREPGLSQDKSFWIGLEGDGKWHTYQIFKKPEGKWKGTLDKLRFDIGLAGDEIEIDWIRIYRSKEPKKIEEQASKTAWEFNKDGDCEGWIVLQNLADVDADNGAMKAKIETNDPSFLCRVEIDSSKYRFALIKMKIDKGSSAQLFWANDQGPVSEQNSKTFKLKPDNEFHEYLVDLGEKDSWVGNISELRFDPNSVPDSNVEIDFIRLLENPPKP